MKFIAGILGLVIWSWLAYLKMTPIEPLIDLLKMGLGGLIVHMLQNDGATPAVASFAPTPAAAPAAQSGRSLWFYPALVAVVALGAMLSGCSTAMVAYESAAYEQAKAVADNHVRITTAMICATPIDAAIRNNFIPIAKVACQPQGGQNGLEDLGAKHPTINVTVQMPASATSEAK